MTELHTFREAVDNIEAGGASHRFGKYPTFYNGPFGMSEQYSTFSKDRSTGFSLEDQQSVDWVLISPDQWRENQLKLAEAAIECSKLNSRISEVVSLSVIDTKPRRWWNFWR